MIPTSVFSVTKTEEKIHKQHKQHLNEMYILSAFDMHLKLSRYTTLCWALYERYLILSKMHFFQPCK